MVLLCRMLALASTAPGARQRRDSWALGTALSLPAAVRDGTVYDLTDLGPIRTWGTFTDHLLEVEAEAEACVVAHARRITTSKLAIPDLVGSINRAS